MSDSKAREAAARATTVALRNAADLVYWWDEADHQIIGGGEPEWTEYAGGVKLADRFDLQAIANAAIDAYIAALAETHAIVPRNPTVAMIRALTATWDEEGKAQVAKWSLGTFAEDYRAMLNAAEPQPTGQR